MITLADLLQPSSYEKLCWREGTIKETHSIGIVVLQLVWTVKNEMSDLSYPTISIELK